MMVCMYGMTYGSVLFPTSSPSASSISLFSLSPGPMCLSAKSSCLGRILSIRLEEVEQDTDPVPRPRPRPQEPGCSGSAVRDPGGGVKFPNYAGPAAQMSGAHRPGEEQDPPGPPGPGAALHLHTHKKKNHTRKGESPALTLFLSLCVTTHTPSPPRLMRSGLGLLLLLLLLLVVVMGVMVGGAALQTTSNCSADTPPPLRHREPISAADAADEATSPS